MTRWIRPSTRSGAALWATAVLDALVFFAIFMGALPWLAHRLLPQEVPLPFWLRAIAGGMLLVVGVAVCGLCFDAFARRGGGTPLPLEAPRRLVTSGPFAVIRNPIIAADAAIILGEALYLASLGVLLYAALFTIAEHYLIVRVEEPELRRRFGEEYEAYCRRVPRWFPG